MLPQPRAPLRGARRARPMRRASGGRTLAVHIQNPLAPLSEFDLVIAMRHDGIDGRLGGCERLQRHRHDRRQDLPDQSRFGWLQRLEWRDHDEIDGRDGRALHRAAADRVR